MDAARFQDFRGLVWRYPRSFHFGKELCASAHFVSDALIVPQVKNNQEELTFFIAKQDKLRNIKIQDYIPFKE